jgi:hypothetical protein
MKRKSGKKTVSKVKKKTSKKDVRLTALNRRVTAVEDYLRKESGG